MTKLQDRYEQLFEVKRKKQTPLSIAISVVMLLVIGNSFFILMNYQKNAYEAFEKEHSALTAAMESYRDEHGTYPLGNPVDWTKEKHLSRFFEENNLSKGISYYHVDLNLMGMKNEIKREYIYDEGRNQLYSRSFVNYGLRRWHTPAAR